MHRLCESRTSGVGPSQRSRFLVPTKRSVASGDKNVYLVARLARFKIQDSVYLPFNNCYLLLNFLVTDFVTTVWVGSE